MDFTVALLEQTFAGLAQAIINQKEHSSELIQLSASTPEEYAAGYITREMVRAEMLALFGEAADGKACRVDAEQPYRPANERLPEDPPIFACCGLTFTEEDFIMVERATKAMEFEGRAKYIISTGGAQRVENAVSLMLANSALKKLRRLVDHGLPEVNVESGRILSKADFRIDSEAENSYGANKMLVRSLNFSGPDAFRLKAGLSGEIEVNFSVGRCKTNGK